MSSLISSGCFECQRPFVDGDTVEIKTLGRLAIKETWGGTKQVYITEQRVYVCEDCK